MNTISIQFATVLLLFGTACNSTSGEPGGSRSDGAAPDTTLRQGAETAPDQSGAPSNPQPTGKSCASPSDCAYFYCRCNDGAVVNSRLCALGACQGPNAHCETACKAFSHGGWSGTYGGGDTPSSQIPDSGSAVGSCTSKEQCSSFQCGCTDGSRIQVRDCYGGHCQDARSGCQRACQDDGRGDWDGI